MALRQGVRQHFNAPSESATPSGVACPFSIDLRVIALGNSFGIQALLCSIVIGVVLVRYDR
jgi:hypothetical protein